MGSISNPLSSSAANGRPPEIIYYVVIDGSIFAIQNLCYYISQLLRTLYSRYCMGCKKFEAVFGTKMYDLLANERVKLFIFF